MSTKFNTVLREHFAVTDDEILIQSRIIIADLPTSASPFVMGDEIKFFIIDEFFKRRENRVKVFSVDGFTSTAGETKYNEGLSRKRADEVKALLDSLKTSVFDTNGIPIGDKLDLSLCKVVGHGELDIPGEEVNTPLARKVEIRFSMRKKLPIPASTAGCSPSSTNWGASFGSSMTPGIIPLVSFSEFTLTLKPDGVNYNGTDIIRNYKAYYRTLPVIAFGFGTLLGKFKKFKTITERIKKMNEDDNFKTIFGAIEDNFISSGSGITPQITGSIKDALRAELKNFMADQLRGLGITINITDWPQENGFITSIPFCFAELQEIDVLGIDITLTSPLGWLSVGLSMYYFPGLNAMFSNFGVSTSPGLTIGELGIDFQWITIR